MKILTSYTPLFFFLFRALIFFCSKLRQNCTRSQMAKQRSRSGLQRRKRRGISPL